MGPGDCTGTLLGIERGTVVVQSSRYTELAIPYLQPLNKCDEMRINACARLRRHVDQHLRTGPEKGMNYDSERFLCLSR
jgi:hypothetical protein